MRNNFIAFLLLIFAVLVVGKHLFPEKQSVTNYLPPLVTPTNTPPIVVEEETCGNCMEPKLMPFIWDSSRRLTTPLMAHYNSQRSDYGDVFRLIFSIPEKWEFSYYDFPFNFDEGAIINYSVQVNYADNPNYHLIFQTQQGEFGNCDFDDTYPDDSPFQVNSRVYRNVVTNFGRVTIATTERSPFLVCQKSVWGYENSSVDWVSTTSIGNILLSVPENPDTEIVDTMIEIIMNVDLLRYDLAS